MNNQKFKVGDTIRITNNATYPITSAGSEGKIVGLYDENSTNVEFYNFTSGFKVSCYDTNNRYIIRNEFMELINKCSQYERLKRTGFI
jgi:hypothetical protein